MASQILFFEKNKADISNANVTITGSQGVGFEDFVRNRSNNSGWVTDGSVDSDNTTLTVDFVDSHIIEDIILIDHNFKAYTIQYWTGAIYDDFSTPIAETVNTAVTTRHNFTAVTTTKLLLTITGTMVADADKYLKQFIATKDIGTFSAWPVIKPELGRNKAKNQMLSGKVSIRERTGARRETLSIKVLSTDADLTTIENLYFANEGFLYWPCGGDESQYRNERIGYRLEDIYLMKCENEWNPAWYQGLYQSGMKIDIKLIEVTD